MKNFKLLDCMRSDCKFTLTDTARVGGYSAPMYDREGNNLAVDLSVTTGKLSCFSKAYIKDIFVFLSKMIFFHI